MIIVQFASLEDFVEELEPGLIGQPVRIDSAEGPPNPSGGPPIWVLRAGVPISDMLYEISAVAAGEESAKQEIEKLQAALEEKDIESVTGSRYEVA